MAAGFRVRRISSGQSLGDRLKKARIRRKISIAEVEEGTRIRAKFILALESDSWEQIPSEVYGRGYLERYAAFLQLPVPEIMGQYDRERSLYARRCHEGQVEFAPRQTFAMPRFLVTPRLLIGATSLAVLLGVTGVLGYQLRQFTAAPYLQVATPVQAQAPVSSDLVVSAGSVTVTGKTAPDANVLVNGLAAIVNLDGSFIQTVKVEKGVNAIMIQATNAKGKTTSQVVSVVVR